MQTPVVDGYLEKLELLHTYINQYMNHAILGQCDINSSIFSHSRSIILDQLRNLNEHLADRVFLLSPLSPSSATTESVETEVVEPEPEDDEAPPQPPPPLTLEVVLFPPSSLSYPEEAVESLTIADLVAFVVLLKFTAMKSICMQAFPHIERYVQQCLALVPAALLPSLSCFGISQVPLPCILHR